MTASLVILIGEISRHAHLIRELAMAGAVILLAPNEEEARRWLELSPPRSRRDRPARHIVRVGRLEVDLTSHRATWQGVVLPLTEREIQIMAALAEDPGRALSFRELTERVWATSYYGGPGPIRAAIQRLRRKLARAQVGGEIEAVRGVGFRLRG